VEVTDTGLFFFVFFFFFLKLFFVVQAKISSQKVANIYKLNEWSPYAKAGLYNLLVGCIGFCINYKINHVSIKWQHILFAASLEDII